MATSFSTKNWNKRTPKFWRNVGDGIMVLGGGLATLVTALPLSEDFKLWALPILTYLILFGKWFTKLFHDENEPSHE